MTTSVDNGKLWDDNIVMVKGICDMEHSLHKILYHILKWLNHVYKFLRCKSTPKSVVYEDIWLVWHGLSFKLIVIYSNFILVRF